MLQACSSFKIVATLGIFQFMLGFINRRLLLVKLTNIFLFCFPLSLELICFLLSWPIQRQHLLIASCWQDQFHSSVLAVQFPTASVCALPHPAQSGGEFISTLIVAQASSTKSIALSGKNRSVIYRLDKVAAATNAVSWIRTL